MTYNYKLNLNCKIKFNVVPGSIFVIRTPIGEKRETNITNI